MVKKPLAELAIGHFTPGLARVTRAELAYAIERWGNFRACVRPPRRVQLQIWTPDEDLARRLCAQYRRKFYTCRVTRPHLAPNPRVYPVTFSQRGTAAILLWARGKFSCERHRRIADAVFQWTEATRELYRARVLTTKMEKYRHIPLLRARQTSAFDRTVREVSRFWSDCPVSLYGEWERTRDAERATGQRVLPPTTTLPPKRKGTLDPY